MTAVAVRRLPVVGTVLGRSRPDLPALSAWMLTFAMVTTLAFEGGGYGASARGQIGIAAWWLLAMGALAGALSLRTTRAGWAAFGLLGVFTVWTALALTWTQSSERTMVEVARNATYLGILALALAAYGRAHIRHALNGVACALVVVAGAAVLARLEPSWIGSRAIYETFPNAQRRLAWPLGYWNLLAGTAAIGIPLLLAAGGAARTTVMRAVAVSAVPVLVLCVYFTISRGGVIFVAVGVVGYVLVARERVARLAHIAVAAGGSLVLCAAANRRDALQSGTLSHVASRQGDELLSICILVVVGCALLAGAVALVARHATPPAFVSPSRRVGGAAMGLAVIVVVAAFFVAGGGHWAHTRIDEFKGSTAPAVSTNDAFSRLSSATSNGRYFYWQSAEKAHDTAPWKGIGPGTFEYWYSEHRTHSGGFVRDAHSLWFQTLAELGWVGLLAIVGLFALALLVGVVRALRSADLEERTLLAGAVGGLAAFAATASLEWAWQMAVLPAAALVLLGACVAGKGSGPLLVAARRRSIRSVGWRRWSVRGVLVAVAIAVGVVIAIPTAGDSALADSRAAVRAGDLSGALADASTASDLQPYSASALLQRALVHEQAGDVRGALPLAVRATAAEPTNWRTWLVRSRLQARSGDAVGALASFRRARSLNPDSPLFAAR